VGLVQHDPRTEQSFDPTIVGLDHLAFTVGSRADLDAWAQRLEERGILHSGAIDVPPGATLNFKDPDGVALSLFWDR
jgi:catechol-2,3-dioxygenase